MQHLNQASDSLGGPVWRKGPWQVVCSVMSFDAQQSDYTQPRKIFFRERTFNGHEQSSCKPAWPELALEGLWAFNVQVSPSTSPASPYDVWFSDIGPNTTGDFIDHLEIEHMLRFSFSTRASMVRKLCTGPGPHCICEADSSQCPSLDPTADQWAKQTCRTASSRARWPQGSIGHSARVSKLLPPWRSPVD